MTAPAAAVTPRTTAVGPAVPSGERADGGWHRYRSEPFTAAAGTLCRFQLHSGIVLDREYSRTTARFADGSARTQEFVGPLVVRVTNVVTGRSVQRDLSARAVVQYHRDGSFEFHLQGPAAVGFHPGDRHRRGYFVLRGLHVVHFAADGTRTVTVDQGREENLCSTLT